MNWSSCQSKNESSFSLHLLGQTMCYLAKYLLRTNHTYLCTITV
nr:MAG TPA: hypothetical protein [Bacteriophage sp.]